MRELALGAIAWRVWARRTLFVLKLKLKARITGGQIDVSVAPDVRFGRNVRVNVAPRSRNRLVIGPRGRIEDGVFLSLKGGSVLLGENVEIRRNTVLNITGELVLAGDNIISYSNVIHCAERITMDRMASTNEFVTIVDSRHFYTDEQTFFYDNTESAPITIGANVWLANKCSVLMGVTIGDCAIVGGHSVVSRDVPARTLVAGAPAKPIRPTLGEVVGA